jgi:hypothetical protein
MGAAKHPWNPSPLRHNLLTFLTVFSSLMRRSIPLPEPTTESLLTAFIYSSLLRRNLDVTHYFTCLVQTQTRLSIVGKLGPFVVATIPSRV